MAIARLALVALDCPDPQELAGFYAAITGWEIETPAWLDETAEGRRWLQLRNQRGPTLAFQRIPDHAPPTWPGGDRPQQLHLDFDVDDLDAGETAVLTLGATKAAVQPDPDEFRVFLDPAGHPFCLVRVCD